MLAYSHARARDHDVLTSVQDVEAGSLPHVSHDRECDYNLGDVILGMSVISEECVCDGVPLEHRLPLVFTHGLCHLLGYTHTTTSNAKLVSYIPTNIVYGCTTTHLVYRNAHVC